MAIEVVDFKPKQKTEATVEVARPTEEEWARLIGEGNKLESFILITFNDKDELRHLTGNLRVTDGIWALEALKMLMLGNLIDGDDYDNS